MKTVTDHIREHLLFSCGYGGESVNRIPGLEYLMETEKSPEFERLRMNRKILGAMRYGLFSAPGKPKWDRISSMIARLEKYRSDRNAEHLVDVANLAEVEFVDGDHLGVVSADDGIHCVAKS